MFLGYPSVSAYVRASGRASCKHDNSGVDWMILTKAYTNILHRGQMKCLGFEGRGIKVKVATGSYIFE